jgi:hypothetical protein
MPASDDPDSLIVPDVLVVSRNIAVICEVDGRRFTVPHHLVPRTVPPGTRADLALPRWLVDQHKLPTR